MHFIEGNLRNIVEWTALDVICWLWE